MTPELVQVLTVVASGAAIIALLWATLGGGGKTVWQALRERKQEKQGRLVESIQGNPYQVAPITRSNLPGQGHLVGREDDSAQLTQLLSDPSKRSLHIKGPAGIGKSALAVHAAQAFLAAHPFENPYIIHISAKASAITRDSLADSVGHFFGVPAVAAQGNIEAKSVVLHRILSELNVLLVLDNVESVDAEVLDFASALPEKVRILRTSRIGPPDRDFAHLWELKPLSEEARRSLMHQELLRLGLGTLENYPSTDVDEILQITGGNPLGIKWATGRLSHGLSMRSVANRLHAADGDLFESMFADNWTELSDASRRGLMACAAQGFTVANSILASQISNQARASENAISALVAVGLLEPIPDPLLPGEIRYGMHPLARAFAQSKLDEDSGRRDDILMGVLQTVTEFLDNRRSLQLGKAEYDRIEGELDNVRALRDVARAAHERGGGSARVALAFLPLVDAVSVYLWSRGYWGLRAAYSELGAEIAAGTDPWAECRNACTVGIVRFWQGRLPEAQQWADRASRAIRGTTRSLEAALPRRLHALIDHRDGGTGPALAEMLSILDSVREARTDPENVKRMRLFADWICPDGNGYRTCEVAITQEIGIMYTDRDNVDEAVYWLDRSATIARAIRDVEGESVALSHKGRALTVSKPDLAVQCFRDALSLAETVGRLSTAGRCHLGLAQLEQSADHLSAARLIFARLGMEAEIAACDALATTMRIPEPIKKNRWRRPAK
jgi:hypothetical protein